jgi:hypothetical protein
MSRGKPIPKKLFVCGYGYLDVIKTSEHSVTMITPYKNRIVLMRNGETEYESWHGIFCETPLHPMIFRTHWDAIIYWLAPLKPVRKYVLTRITLP